MINNFKDYIEVKLILQKAMELLSEEEKYILIHRYGLFENNKKTAKEVSAELKTEIHKIYHIEKQVISKIKLAFARLNLDYNLFNL